MRSQSAPKPWWKSNVVVVVAAVVIVGACVVSHNIIKEISSELITHLLAVDHFGLVER